MEVAGCRGGCLEVGSGPDTVLAELAQMSYREEGERLREGCQVPQTPGGSCITCRSAAGGSIPFLGIVQKGRAAPGMQSHFLYMGWAATPNVSSSPQCWAHPDITEMRLASQDGFRST